ncbi:hypothetical protein SIN8267_03348 [Sinobacterium norvegicum]|uniref:Type IV pilus assembly protein PilW n=1 Tax=Sinobacterium norvegicum TaxID=1641715 RepID=A0ABM9AJ06_9GAMM|nr:PilW family protein [Sinobacterium norvegicum]CAH0993207.1 hypothetical protein SIN8267_03348 [Sinobacterium norvegicum]
MKHKQSSQLGLTMIELMVAMVMGAILILGITQTFVAHKKSHSLQAGMSRVQEGGRIAMEMMSRDVRMADYWGCAKSGMNLTNNVDFDANDPDEVAKFDFLFAGGVEGEDSVNGKTLGTLSLVDGSDLVTLRGASASDCPVTGVNTQSAVIKVSTCDIPKGDLVLISDCLAGDIFQNTGAGIDHDLGHNTGNSVSPGNTARNNSGAHCNGGNPKCLSQVYDAGAQILKPYSVSYFVATNATTGEPGLYKRDSINGTANELIDGVETMQITYAVDTAYDSSATIVDLELPSRSASRFMTGAEIEADASVKWDQVIGMKVDLLLRSHDGVTEDSAAHTISGQSFGASDNRMRKVYTTTMNIRNRSMPSAEGL